MKMSEVIKLVNEGKAVYKFSRFGSVYSGLRETSFTPAELNSCAFGFLKMNDKLFFRKLG